MADNKNKIDQLHDLLPKHFNTRNNTNWKALVEAIGEADQDTANLVNEVRKQFFVKTASRPYLDRLAANNKIARPRLVGMDDTSFREYIPVLSYQPKQVKLIIDQLLDIFFFKESTTAYITTNNFSPYDLDNGWELELLIDEQHSDRVVFKNSDFVNINAATANEIVGAINRQAKYCYAMSYYDSITKNTYIRLFTTTVGSKGSIRILGGRSNISLRFNGFLDNAGNSSNTQWTVTKIGDETTFTHTAGNSPNINELQVGDIMIINIAGNIGSYVLTKVDLVNDSVSFINLFSTAGIFTQTSSDEVKFIRSEKIVAFKNPKRAMTWETNAGELTVEMPTSPPVVKRSLKGSIHVNGVFSQMSNRDSDTALTVVNANQFPESGSFLLERLDEMQYRILTPTENQVVSKFYNTRLNYSSQKYNYTSRVALATTGDIVEGSNQITNLTSIVGLAVGQQVKMNGIPSYAQVINISGMTATISAAATETITGQTVKFMGNQLVGITPNLPIGADLYELTLTSLSRTGNIVTGVTTSPHSYNPGEPIILSDSSGIFVFSTTGDISNFSNVISNIASMSGIAEGLLISGPGIPTGTTVISVGVNSVIMSNSATANNIGATINLNENLNGTKILTSASGNSFTFQLYGTNGVSSIPGTTRMEKIGLANSGSKVIITDAVQNDVSRITGAYMWDTAASFVLSSKIADISDAIQAGKIIRLLNIASNDISEDGGFLIFDYGKINQEGPVRYLYKPTDNTIALDPSYTFKYNHAIGSPIVAINKKGPHRISSNAAEYPAYITDPSEARFILEDLIRSVKSAGIFVNFLVRYPEQLYATLDVYRSGIDPG